MMEGLNSIVDRQQRLIQVGVFGTAALVGFAESRADRTVAIIVYLLVPVAAASLASMWLREVSRLRDAVAAAEDTHGSTTRRDPWRNELTRAAGLTRVVEIAAASATLISGFLIWREIRGIEDGVGTYDPLVATFVGIAWASASIGVWIVAWSSLRGPEGQ
jgi:hypothetical protein